MSKYLNRLKQLRDAPITDSFQSPNVHSNVSFRKAIDYIERLEAERIPEELFDGHAVLNNIDNPDTRTHSPAEMVSKVLDSVVDLIKRRINEGK